MNGTDRSSDKRCLHVLGMVRLERDGQETVLRGTQPRALLGYLTLHNDRSVPRDELATILWPLGPSKHWEGALRGVITKVRSFLHELGPTDSDDALATIETTDLGYRLLSHAGVSIDLWEVDAEAKRILEGGPDREPGEPMLETITTAAERLAAPFLAGLDANWITVARARLDETRLRYLRLASEQATIDGRGELAIAFARTAVESEVYDERNHRALIAANLAAGNRADALRAYSRCRSLLTDELGQSPDPATERLYRKALEVREHATAAGGPAPRPSEYPLPTLTDRIFVGRLDELASLHRAWTEVLGGRRKVVLVQGEAGVGKTRLAFEATRRAHPANLLYGRCSAEQIVPFEPFAEAIGRHLERLDGREVERIAGPSLPELEAILPGLAARQGGTRLPETVEERTSVFKALEATLRRIAAEPTMLVVDDLHWADPSTLLALQHLVDADEHVGLLLIATLRLGNDLTEDVAAACRQLDDVAGAVRIELPTFDAKDVSDLLAAIDVPAADVLGPVLHERTGGNGFYVNQILTTFGQASQPIDLGTIPDSVKEVVRLRVASLSEPARDVLAMAAIIGTVVPDDLLCRAADLGPSTDQAIAEAAGADLLRPEAIGRLVFPHGIVRDAVYGQLSRARRRSLHRRVAACLDEADGDDVLNRAHHYLMADDPAAVPETIAAATTAVSTDMAAHAYEHAAELCRRTLQYVSRWAPDEPRVAALQLSRGTAQRRAGDATGAIDALRSAIDRAKAAHQPEIMAKATLELVAKGWRGAAVEMPDSQRAELLDDAAAALDHAGADVALRVSVLVELALALVQPAQRARQRAVAGEAVTRARGDDRPELMARAVEAQRLFLTSPTDSGARLQHTEDLVIEANGLPPHLRLRAYMWRLHDQLELGARQGIEHDLRRLRSLADSLGLPHWQWVGATWRALSLFLGGDTEDADALAADALQQAGEADHAGRAVAHAIQAIGFRLIEGRGAEVVQSLRTGAEALGQFSAIRCALALALAQSGEGEEATELLTQLAGRGLDVISADLGGPFSLACLAATSGELGNADVARQLLPRLEPFRDHFVVVSAGGPAGACWGPYAAVLGSLRACIGDRGGAHRDFDHALTALRGFDAPYLGELITAQRDRHLAVR